MPVESLFSEDVNTRRPVNRRYPAEVVEAYETDLREILQLSEGKARPPMVKICEYMDEVHGIRVTPDTVKRHLKLLENGKDLWPKS